MGSVDKAQLCLPASILEKLSLDLVVQISASDDSAVASLISAPASVHTSFFGFLGLPTHVFPEIHTGQGLNRSSLVPSAA